MTLDLEQVARDRQIKYFLVSFSDLAGTVRAKLVPTAAIGAMSRNGAGFAGFATWLDMTPADPDILAVPDAGSLIQLPWKPEVAWVAADLKMNDRPVCQAPRTVLKEAMRRAAELGYELRTGVECEFFVLDSDGRSIADAADRQLKPCYDQQALMRHYELISEICDAMQSLGWGPYQTDHEDANGQFEMNWEYADALTTADRHTFFKYMVKTLAEARGLRATFMPKPFANRTGNGCHIHLSLWDAKKGSNLFFDAKGELGLSALGYQFIGGVMHSAPALCAYSNPTVNSYRRINAPVTSSGATWSPNTVSYAGNNRTHMIRIPEPGRFELRLPDGSANPYLLAAAVLQAGLEGIAQRRNPGERLDTDMYASRDPRSSPARLPDNLLEALKALESSAPLTAGMGECFTKSYLKLKHDEWRRYGSHVSAWELEQTLDC